MTAGSDSGPAALEGSGRDVGVPLRPPEVGRLTRDARAVLRSWRAPDPEQEALRRDFLTHLDGSWAQARANAGTPAPGSPEQDGSGPGGSQHGDALVLKSGPPTHLTASCLLLDPSGSRVLLTLHRRAGRWFQLGGHLEADDLGLRSAAEREAREESGIDAVRLSAMPVHLDRHALVGSFGRCRTHLDVRYAGVAPADAIPRLSDESVQLRWFDVDDLPADTADQLRRPVALARRALADNDI